ncbi:TRAP transporter substrate-binding protein DctP [Enterocloster bolteae]|uniref:TRAP transporter substrate-binding protein DctP n=1 Tax=Enterocloster bolteae TaxID=208479 RepID=UPI00210E0477|nr:TRAP transporter substrate-binding protein DctP [Enterocloster bolteae]MCQ5141856.1 TRAP transporter substrate-binding protein DctP [Enterocloster bolteae]
MKTNKKLLSLIMILAITLSSTACGTKSQNTLSSSGTSAPESKSTPAMQTAEQASTPTSSTPEYTIRYAFTSPQNSQVGKIAEGFKERVESLSNGRITVEMYPDAQLGDKAANLESVRTGELEMCDASASDMSGYNGRWSVFSFPYMYNDSREMLDVVRSDTVFTMLDSDTTDAGFKIITFADFGSRNVFANKAVRTPADAKGIKIRVMNDPILAKTMELMGFSAISLGWSEVYTAMQQGTIDALEQNEALCADNMLFEVANTYSYTEQFRIPGIQYMSAKFYDSLPEDLQEAVIQAGIENEELIYQWFPEYNQKSIDVLKENGVTFVDTDKDSFIEATAPIKDYYFSLNTTPTDAQELYDAMIAARSAIRGK